MRSQHCSIDGCAQNRRGTGFTGCHRQCGDMMLVSTHNCLQTARPSAPELGRGTPLSVKNMIREYLIVRFTGGNFKGSINHRMKNVHWHGKSGPPASLNWQAQRLKSMAHEAAAQTIFCLDKCCFSVDQYFSFRHCPIKLDSCPRKLG